MKPIKIFPLGGHRYINGLSSNYDSHTYPEEIKPYLSRDQFQDIIEQINNTLQNFWSCDLCHYFGWGCSLCTLGLSFLCPLICIKDAESEVNNTITSINEYSLIEKGLKIKLRKKCFQSWLEISYLNQMNQTTKENVNKKPQYQKVQLSETEDI